MDEERSDPQYLSNDSEEDRIINSYYCGQIYILHHLLHYIFKEKIPKENVIKFIEGRYCYLIHQYPNFYNRLINSDKELGAEAKNSYRLLFESMMRHHKYLFNENERKT